MSEVHGLVDLITRAGIGIPRGLVGEEIDALARAIAEADSEPDEIAALTEAAAAAHWEGIRGPVEAGLRRAAAHAPVDEDAAYVAAVAHADDPDADNPLARLLAAQAAAALSAARDRSQERMVALDAAIEADGPRLADSVADSLGAITVDLLDLDPEDYEPEIVAFIDAGRTKDARDRLARETSDEEVRHWARRALGTLDADPPAAAAAIAQLAAGLPPEDPADDPVWVGATLTLVEEAISLAMASDD